MSIFLHIFAVNILPIFLIIVLGYVLSMKFNLNVQTLSKLNFYAFVPSFIFVNLYTANLVAEMYKVLLCGIMLLVINNYIGVIMARIRGYDTSMKNAFKNSIMFNNSGNIGLSLVTLVFSSAPFVIDVKTPYLQTALTAQIIILVLQNITTNTVGLFNASMASMNWRQSLKKIFSMPAVYAIPTALILRNISVDMEKTAVWPALIYLKNGLIPVVLIALGAQLQKTKLSFINREVQLSVLIRLIAGPAIAFAAIYLFGFSGIIAQTIMIAYSVPTAVNTALIAVEYRNCEAFASQSVMLSTLLSSITLTAVIYLSRIVFPV